MKTSIKDRIKAASAPGFDPNGVDFDVWGTQAGGLATWDPDAKNGEGAYVWLVLPDWMVHQTNQLGQPTGEKGYPQPDVIPANEAARRQMEREDGDWVMSTIDLSWGDF